MDFKSKSNHVNELVIAPNINGLVTQEGDALYEQSRKTGGICYIPDDGIRDDNTLLVRNCSKEDLPAEFHEKCDQLAPKLNAKRKMFLLLWKDQESEVVQGVRLQKVGNAWYDD